jgi:FixJ family two-component response regulator
MASAPRDTVAVVDDDEAVRHSLRLLFEVIGHKVESFASAAEFLKAELGELICLIVDHHMPGITGLELAERLRAEGSPVPIMLITARPHLPSTRAPQSLGSTKFWRSRSTKPSCWHSSTRPSAECDR